MTLDTKDKRVSVIGAGRIYLRDKNPQAGKDDSWRKATGQCYSAPALTAPVLLPIVRHHIRMGR